VSDKKKHPAVIVLNAMLEGIEVKALKMTWGLSEDHSLIVKMGDRWVTPLGTPGVSQLFQIAESLSFEELFLLSSETALSKG
jgi:hypothetical protein